MFGRGGWGFGVFAAIASVVVGAFRGFWTFRAFGSFHHTGFVQRDRTVGGSQGDFRSATGADGSLELRVTVVFAGPQRIIFEIGADIA